MATCNGHTTKGQPCRAKAVNGSTKCRKHGGATPRGIASPHYKTGIHSKYLPTRLLERYHASMADGRALSLREDIAIVDSRITELIGRLDTRESGSTWQQARNALDGLRDALRNGDGEAVTDNLRSLNEAINAGRTDYQTWQELHNTIDQRRKLVESERRLMVELQQMMTIEDATMLLDAVAQSIKRNVTDVAALRAIQADLTTLLGTTAHQPVNTGNTIEREFD